MHSMQIYCNRCILINNISYYTNFDTFQNGKFNYYKQRKKTLCDLYFQEHTFKSRFCVTIVFCNTKWKSNSYHLHTNLILK